MLEGLKCPPDVTTVRVVWCGGVGDRGLSWSPNGVCGMPGFLDGWLGKGHRGRRYRWSWAGGAVFETGPRWSGRGGGWEWRRRRRWELVCCGGRMGLCLL